MTKSTSRAKAPRKSATKSPSKGRTPPEARARPGETAESASRRIDQRIRDLGGWRGETLARMRALILEADPEMIEECKWVKPTNPLGVPVWSHAGIVCTGEAYAKVVKLTFARGASIPDPSRLFNSSLDGNMRRAIDIREGEKVDAGAFRALVKAAVTANAGTKAKGPPKAGVKATRGAKAAMPIQARGSEKVVLLSGGNPQIAKADGDPPVQAFIAAMPGWKRDVGERLDALIVRHVPNVQKAVRWNSPFYGIEGRGWFLSFHCFTKYVKVTFLRGTSLRPLPPVESKDPDTRYLHVHENDPFDEGRVAGWIRQAAKLPGAPLF